MFLIPRHAEGKSLWILSNCWRKVCADAGIARLRLHDLRHTVACQAFMAGDDLPLIRKVLGHRRCRTNACYTHPADGHLVEIAENVGRSIAKFM